MFFDFSEKVSIFCLFLILIASVAALVLAAFGVFYFYKLRKNKARSEPRWQIWVFAFILLCFGVYCLSYGMLHAVNLPSLAKTLSQVSEPTLTSEEIHTICNQELFSCIEDFLLSACFFSASAFLLVFFKKAKRPFLLFGIIALLSLWLPLIFDAARLINAASCSSGVYDPSMGGFFWGIGLINETFNGHVYPRYYRWVGYSSYFLTCDGLLALLSAATFIICLPRWRIGKSLFPRFGTLCRQLSILFGIPLLLSETLQDSSLRAIGDFGWLYSADSYFSLIFRFLAFAAFFFGLYSFGIAPSPEIRPKKDDALTTGNKKSGFVLLDIGKRSKEKKRADLENQKMDLLVKYKKLYDDGVITEEEFTKKKEEILKS